MFDHGIEQNVAVEDLTVVVSESHMHAKKKKAMEEEAVTPEGGEDSSKASKKGKPEMPLEKLKAIMEKKKSEAYKAMLRSQGKMEEEVEQVDELNKSTLASYVNKAAHQVRAKSGIASSFETQGERKRDPENKAAYANLAKDFRVGAKKRLTGIEKATAKLAKEEVELDEKKLTSAEMKKREEVAKAIERDQPEMPMGKKMAIATATAKKVAEAKAHTVPKTPKEKDLAALAAPHDKITHADVMVGRGVSKKKTMKEFVEQLAESLSSKAE